MSFHEMRLPCDIFHLVIQHCTDDKRALFGIALTCQTLSEPALRELWHTMDSLVPLLLLIPLEFYHKDHFQGPGSLHPVLCLPEDRWMQFRRDDSFCARMLAYGKYIMTLRGVDSDRFRVEFGTLQFLLEELPWILGVEHILPNLTKLSLKNNELTHVAYSYHIRGLVVSNLRSIVLTLSCKGVLRNLDQTIMTALRNCPRLVSLRVISTERFCEELVPLTLESCLFPTPQEFDMLSMTARASSIKIIRILPAYRSGLCDIVSTPATLIILGLFKSITDLRISVDTSDQFRNHPLFKGPNSAFPALQYLWLRLHGSDPMPWFFDALDTTNLRFLYLHFVREIRTSDLDEFTSSLGKFKDKFYKVSGLGFRATVCEEEDRAIPSVVAAAARLSPSLTHLKLKLFPSLNNHPQIGLVQAADLCCIAGAFPKLQTLQVASNSRHVHLTDVVALARRFPGLRKIEINFQHSAMDLPRNDAPELSPPDGDLGTSGLRTFDVKHSCVVHPELVAAYLRKRLPALSSVVRAPSSSFKKWDKVNELLSDRR